MKNGRNKKRNGDSPVRAARPAQGAPPAAQVKHDAHPGFERAKQAEPARHGLLYALFTRKRPQKQPPPPAPEPGVSGPRAATARARPVANPTLVRMYRRLSGAMPRGLVRHFEVKMRFAGISAEESVTRLGKAVLVSILAGVFPLLLYIIIFNPIATPATVALAAGLFSGGFILSATLFYLALYFRVADRAAAVEKLLPDFLSLVVSNLRAGLSPYAAFVQAARPEFGAFHDSIVLAMARMGGKASIADAFLDVSENFDSAILRRTVTLFAKGVRSGGQLVRLLNSSADEVRRIHDLRAELISSTRTYSIFLSFIAVTVMPFLLAVSSNFVTVFISLQMDTTSMQGTAQLPSFSGKILINPADMETISIITLVVTNLLVSVLIGVVDRGKAIYGIRSFPILLVLSTCAFFLAKAIIGSFLSNFMI